MNMVKVLIHTHVLYNWIFCCDIDPAVTLTLLFMISVVEKKLKAAQELSENFEVSRTLIVLAVFFQKKKLDWKFGLKYATFP